MDSIKMEWTSLLSTDRLNDKLGKDQRDSRSEFQRDIDRIVFSPAFRRLQNKTQVFPLPSNDFLRTRLTHSLEVAMVGRTLGLLAGKYILMKERDLRGKFTPDDFANIVVAACLVHDVGNPPFGHSGEDAIGQYFNHKEELFRSDIFKRQPALKNDLLYFEGNAAGLRILTKHQTGRVDNGLGLTFATLGCFIKYPTDSIPKQESKRHPKQEIKVSREKLLNPLGLKLEKRKSLSKFGYFQSEAETYKKIAKKCGLLKLHNPRTKSWTHTRHPLNFLMEAADTICFKMIDLEDGHRAKLISTDETIELLKAIVDSNKEKSNDEKLEQIEKIEDDNEKVTALRTRALRVLVYECAEVFETHYDNIMKGVFDDELTDKIKSRKYLDIISKICERSIYKHPSVVEIELAGFEVMKNLLEYFIHAIQSPKEAKSKKLLDMLPNQFKYSHKEEPAPLKEYYDLMRITNYVSGMTDSFAVDLYRKISGIELPFY